VSQTQFAGTKPTTVEKVKTAQYTPEPWHLVEKTPGISWIVAGKSLEHGARQIASIPDANHDEEQQANARLIATAPALHRAAVKLMCVWGTDDAQEVMGELSVILSAAMKV
jgi:hypothetical protein